MKNNWSDFGGTVSQHHWLSFSDGNTTVCRSSIVMATPLTVKGPFSYHIHKDVDAYRALQHDNSSNNHNRLLQAKRRRRSKRQRKISTTSTSEDSNFTISTWTHSCCRGEGGWLYSLQQSSNSQRIFSIRWSTPVIISSTIDVHLPASIFSPTFYFNSIKAVQCS